MMKKVAIYMAALAVVLGVVSATARADQVPVGCNSNRLTLSISRDKLTVKQGDVLTYTVSVSNLDSPPNLACNIDGATVTLTLPAPDGTPTGDVVTLATNEAYPPGQTWR